MLILVMVQGHPVLRSVDIDLHFFQKQNLQRQPINNEQLLT